MWYGHGRTCPIGCYGPEVRYVKDNSCDILCPKVCVCVVGGWGRLKNDRDTFRTLKLICQLQNCQLTCTIDNSAKIELSVVVTPRPPPPPPLKEKQVLLWEVERGMV